MTASTLSFPRFCEYLNHRHRAYRTEIWSSVRIVRWRGHKAAPPECLDVGEIVVCSPDIYYHLEFSFLPPTPARPRVESSLSLRQRSTLLSRGFRLLHDGEGSVRWPASARLSADARAHLGLLPESRFLSLRPRLPVARGGGAALDYPGVLDLFSGRRGWSREALRRGAPWALTFDTVDSPDFQDVSLPPVLTWILRGIQLGCFRVVGEAPPCSSHSTAVRPLVRTPQFPAGIPGASAKWQDEVDRDNVIAVVSAEIFYLCRVQSGALG